MKGCNDPNDKIMNFGCDFPDGRLTMPSKQEKYDFRKVVAEVKRLGRPLRKKEFSGFVKK